MNKLVHKETIHQDKKDFKKIKYLLLYFSFCLILVASFPIQKTYAQVEEDPRDDLYEISLLDFMYVIGDTYPDTPEDADDLIDLVNALISRSREVTSPSGIDIREVNVYVGPLYSFLDIEMEGDIDNCDYARIYTFIESDHTNRWIGLEMELDGSSEEFSYKAYGDVDEDNATGDFTGEHVWIAFNNSVYDFNEDDTVLVFSMTGDPDFHDFLNSRIRYDFCPNSAIDESLLIGSYTGDDIITQFLDDIAHYLFGWIWDGAIPFLLLIALLITVAQVLADRKNIYLHWIGIIGGMAICYPIIMYSISLFDKLTGIMGIPNIFSYLELFTLTFFLLFIVLSGFNQLGWLKHHRFAFTIGLVLMCVEAGVYLFLNPTAWYWFTLIILCIGCALLNILLRFSKKFGRNKFAT